MSARRAAAARSPIVLLGALLALYLAVPVVALLVRVARAPAGFSNPGLLDALWVSAATATITTALVSVLGVPLAYVLARSRGRLAGALGALVQLPLAVPPVMSGIMLIYLVGPYTWLGRLAGGRLTESMAGIVLAQSFVAAPFLVVTARSAFRAVDPTLYDMAATLGRGEPARFVAVALPVAADGVRAGMLLAWLRAFGEYGATVVLAYHPYSLPVFTYLQFSGSGLQLTSAPTVLSLGVAVVVLALARVPLGRRRRAVAAPSGRRTAALGPEAARLAPAESAQAVRAAPPPAPLTARCSLHLESLRHDSFRLEVALAAPSGRLAIVGPSGSGKSATLRCLAGLFGPGSGDVRLGGESLSGLLPEHRPIGYVSQGLALFPHLDVSAQVSFGAGADPELARAWLERFGVGDLGSRRPEQLSGGERQRVRLAQALARSPRLLLLDEPLSALDVPVRAGLREELRRLQRTTSLTTVLVTHDPAEAATLAEDVAVLAGGVVLQSGTRREVFGRPVSAEVARLLGWQNVSRAVVVAPGIVIAGGTRVEVPTGGLAPGTACGLGVRPEAVSLAGRGAAALPAVLEDAADVGAFTELVLRLGDELVLRVPSPGRGVPPPGSALRVVLDPEGIVVWPGHTPRPEGSAAQPPMRDIERAGRKKPGSSMP